MSLLHEAPPAVPVSKTPSVRTEPASQSGVELVAEARSAERSRELAALGYLVARTHRLASGARPGPDTPTRGALRDALEGAIEMALALRGAVPPNVAVGVEARAMAHDQLFRVRALGARGLAVVVPQLLRLADEDGVLDARDSEVLAVWRRLSEHEPVVLLLDEEDAGVSVHAPIALERWVAPTAVVDAPRSVGWPDDERSVDDDAYDRPSDLDFDPDEIVLLDGLDEPDDEPLAEHQEWHRASREPAVAPASSYDHPAGGRPATGPVRTTRRDGAAARHAATTSADGASVMRHDPLAGVEDDLDEPDFTNREALHDDVFAEGMRAPDLGELAPNGLFSALTPTPSVVDVAPPKKDRKASGAPRKGRATSGRRAMAKALEAEDDGSEDGLAALPAREETASVTTTARHTRRFDGVRLREHATALSNARGSRPVKQIEQHYVEHYVPLLEALSAGFDDREAERALTAWRSGFEKSYQESFATIRVTGKRPKMVLDAPEEAVRIGRHHGARSVQLVLVDGLRYGLGERVERRLAAQMSDIGSAVEQSLLWSALPSVTSVQMQLLSQGASALREVEGPTERDLTAYRDGTACIPRRERIGQRDLLKLDVVEARMRDAGGPYERRMDDLAEEVADAIVKVAEGLPPRTLLYVFGDHGFVLRNVSEERTGRAEQGGARPEEVLVPGYAWLVGGPT